MEEEEKKPKRPRIGAPFNPNRQQTGYNQQEGYERPQGGYDRQQSGYNRQQAYNRHSGGYNRQSGYNQNRTQQGGGYERPQGGYERQQGGYNRQQGYNNQGNTYNRQNNYNQGGYNRQQGYNNQGNTYNRQNNYNQGGYNRNGNQGGYERQQSAGYNRQNNYNQGGYNRNNNQTGYNRHGGYNRNSNQGGYGHQGGYNHGGYNQGSYGAAGNRPAGQHRPYGNRQAAPGNAGNRPNNPKFSSKPRQIDYVLEDVDPNAELRLNKYMANAGLCSRREADEYITSGKVKVNGEVVTELGTKISRNDVVEFDDKVVTPERKCYVLLNKPKDCVTTSDDPNGRTTVLDIVKGACDERIYPVGRLDRNTTGVLLLTNDGDLASKLTHPKYVKKKIYHVWTDKDIAEEDMQRIADGIELEDGEIHADAISYVSDERNQAGIEIHSGRNRIVRRIFEHLGYRVIKLDRVYFAGLTKKNLPRGRWRYLTQDEVNYLRMGAFE
ncbi:MAG: RNA-binding S4 domain-containing protein [Muribaculaceae bacterium]|nr:RNA-binding S4 domain-containing protein [Muribaculaceae bacterium]